MFASSHSHGGKYIFFACHHKFWYFVRGSWACFSYFSWARALSNALDIDNKNERSKECLRSGLYLYRPRLFRNVMNYVMMNLVPFHSDRGHVFKIYYQIFDFFFKFLMFKRYILLGNEPKPLPLHHIITYVNKKLPKRGSKRLISHLSSVPGLIGCRKPVLLAARSTSRNSQTGARFRGSHSQTLRLDSKAPPPFGLPLLIKYCA